MEFTKEARLGLVINAIAVPTIVDWVLANALHLERVSRGMLATMLELAALGVAPQGKVLIEAAGDLT